MTIVIYSNNNSGWGEELRPYNQYKEERTPNLESVFEEFIAYHASSKANQNSVQNQEIQFVKIVKEERHGEQEKALSVILSLITSTSLAMIWKVFPGYMSFMESLAKRKKCKEDVLYVTFMPP